MLWLMKAERLPLFTVIAFVGHLIAFGFYPTPLIHTYPPMYMCLIPQIYVKKLCRLMVAASLDLPYLFKFILFV
jgi:hypothetical protein